MSKPKEHNLLRAPVERGLAKEENAVDRENKVINGYAVMSKGNVKDFRNWVIDDQTLDQIVEAGNRLKLGVKSRFGHPNMSGEALGTFVGRAKNFRRDGDIVRADLHISDSAFNSPNGDLGTYILDLAENEPDMFGTSVVLNDFDLEQQLEKNGKQKRDKKTGDPLPPLLRVKKISASDVVDEPAANNGMFANQFFSDGVMLSAEMSEFLNKFLSQPEAVEKAIDFLNRYQRFNSRSEDHRNDENEQLNNTEENDMDLENLTLEQLQEARPDLVAELQSSISVDSEENNLEEQEEEVDQGTEQDVLSERDRSKGIMDLLSQDDFKEYHDLALECIEKGDSLSQAEKKFFQRRLGELKSGAAQPVPPSADEPPELSHMPEGEEKWKAEFKQSPELQQEFRGNEASYLSYKRAEKRGAIRL